MSRRQGHGSTGRRELATGGEKSKAAPGLVPRRGGCPTRRGRTERGPMNHRLRTPFGKGGHVFRLGPTEAAPRLGQKAQAASTSNRQLVYRGTAGFRRARSGRTMQGARSRATTTRVIRRRERSSVSIRVVSRRGGEFASTLPMHSVTPPGAYLQNGSVGCQ